MPTVIVLAVAEDDVDHALCAAIASRLGIEAERVRLIGAADAEAIGLADLDDSVGDATAAVAIGAALSGEDDSSRHIAAAPSRCRRGGAIGGAVRGIHRGR